MIVSQLNCKFNLDKSLLGVLFDEMLTKDVLDCLLLLIDKYSNNVLQIHSSKSP